MHFTARKNYSKMCVLGAVGNLIKALLASSYNLKKLLIWFLSTESDGAYPTGIR